MKQKIIIMWTPTQITDEEIQSFMDFDALLQLRDKTVQQQRSPRKIKKLFIGLACLLLIPAGFYALKELKPDRPARIHSTPQQNAKAPVLVPDDRGPDTLAVNAEEEPLDSSALPKAESKRGASRAVTTPDPQKTEHALENDTVVPVYVQAVPAEGYPLLYEYFDRNLVYPTSVISDSVEGTLNVTFIIDQTGNAVDIKVENSPGPSFEREAIRLVENMPFWKPASYNGVPVKSKISLPISFRIRKIKKD